MQRRALQAGAVVLFGLAFALLLWVGWERSTYRVAATLGIFGAPVLITVLTMYVSRRQKALVATAVEQEGAFWGCWLFPREVRQTMGGPLTVSDTEIRWQPGKQGRAYGLAEVRLSRADVSAFELPRVQVALRNNIPTVHVVGRSGETLNGIICFAKPEPLAAAMAAHGWRLPPPSVRDGYYRPQ